MNVNGRTIEKFRIAVLGATGFIGSPYRREIRDCPDDGRIVSLGGRRLDSLKAAATEDGAEFFSDDWRKVIGHAGVNLVLICTPDALHHAADRTAAIVYWKCARRAPAATTRADRRWAVGASAVTILWPLR